MISIDIEFLTGRYCATAYNDRSKGEWPPEPARLFSACVATLHETEELGEEVLASLRWLEGEGAPYVVASQAERRTVSNVYVPVNDPQLCKGWQSDVDALNKAKCALQSSEPGKKREKAEKQLGKKLDKLRKTVEKTMLAPGSVNDTTLKIAKSMLPEGRLRQPRTFPSVTPWIPHISFVWPDADPAVEVRDGLERLLSCLVRLGHSSSLVQAKLGEGELLQERPEDVWIPDPRGQDATLRVFEEGQIERLESAFQVHQGTEPRIMPCSYQNYRKGVGRTIELGERSVFGEDWVIFRLAPEPERRRPTPMSLTRSVLLTRTFRAALMSHASSDALEALSGHAADGSPLKANHVAFVPLADVAGQWARGSVLGLALVLPRAMPEDIRAAVFRAIGSLESEAGETSSIPKLAMGRAGHVYIERLRELERRTTLRAQTWCRSARRWATVTPIALDRHPGDLSSHRPQVAHAAAQRAEEIVAESCVRIGLPRPSGVQVMPRSLYDAAPHTLAYPRFPKSASRPKRMCVHAEIEFAQPVHGPLILGAGRYFGLGLCRGMR